MSMSKAVDEHLSNKSMKLTADAATRNATFKTDL